MRRFWTVLYWVIGLATAVYIVTWAFGWFTTGSYNGWLTLTVLVVVTAALDALRKGKSILSIFDD